MKQNSRLLNEEISKIKKMMSINDGVLSESSFKNVDSSVSSFKMATTGMLGTNIDGIIAVLNNIPDRLTLFNFITTLQNKVGKSFQSIINDEFEEDNSADAEKIQKLLKSKFNVDSDPGLGGNPSLPARQRPFIKKFKITNYNSTPQQQAGYTQTMKDEDSAMIITKTGPNATDFVVTKPGEPTPKEWKPEETKQQVTTASPQTYNDILSGKGVLKSGVTSPAVGELQQKLLDLGYSAVVKPTNYFGTETLNSVIDFQTKNSLNPDGKVGTNTSKKIDQILDIRKRRSASQGEVVPGVPDTKLPDTSISGLSNQKSTTTTSTSPNTRGLTTAVQSYVPKGVSRTADFS
jgi:hypothetical protein